MLLLFASLEISPGDIHIGPGCRFHVVSTLCYNGMDLPGKACAKGSGHEVECSMCWQHIMYFSAKCSTSISDEGGMG